MQMRFVRTLLCASALLITTNMAPAADQPQWGERHTRNMLSGETGLPTNFDPATGDHILWSASLGGGSYSSPIVAGGKVFIGANNTDPRDPRHKGDRGVMLCLNEKDGSLCWQLVVPRTGGDDYLDWPGIGLCSEPTIEGDRIYTVTNRSEVVCLDLNGLANGNDGPFTDEARHQTPADQPPFEPGPTDADILWLYDMRAGVGVYPHDSQHVSILIDGDYLYLNTGNGVDNTHVKIRAPEAPCLIVLDKKTGRLVAKDGEGIGPRIFHCTWSPPSLGEVGGRREIFFGGPDGVVYAFNALPPKMPETVQILERAWRFDCDPTGPKEDVHRWSKNTKEGPSEIMGMPVFHKNRIYVTVGGDIWWGKYQASLKCIDAAKTGDVTGTAALWSYPLERYSVSTPAIVNNLVFVTDGKGTLHCVDADTGQAYWTHDVGNSIWGSALAADGKVYVGARDGAFMVFAADKTKNLLFTTKFPDEINGTPTAAKGVLYVSTLSRIYSIR
jgi:outer membrane protein assembly factor BamB